MEISELARQLAARRKTQEKMCPICGVTFMAFGRRTYDTKACANKASYRRVGRERRAPRPTATTEGAGDNGRICGKSQVVE